MEKDDLEFFYENFSGGVSQREVDELKKRISEVNSKLFDMRTIILQLAFSAGWTREQVSNIIGASEDEMKCFGGEQRGRNAPFVL